MLRLPLVGGSEVVIFGKNLTVVRAFEKKHSDADGDITTYETVRVEDGNHGNGGWQIRLSFDEVIRRVQVHLGETL